MDNYQIAKEANAIAHQIVYATKNLKNDTRFGHDQSAKCAAEDIQTLCNRLTKLIGTKKW